MPELLDWCFNFKAQIVKTGLAIFHFALIFYFVYRFGKRRNVIHSGTFWSAFLVRLAGGVMLGLIYIYYYSFGDTWIFFEDARKLSELARSDFSGYVKVLTDFGEDQNLLNLVIQDWRSIFFVKLISLFCLLSGDNYWVCAAYFSFFSFITSWSLHARVTEMFPGSSQTSAMAFLFFPSVVVWGSGVEKESLALCGIYFLSRVCLSLLAGDKIRTMDWLLVAPIGFLVWYLKYYWAGIFIISAGTAVGVHFLMTRFLWVKRYVPGVWVGLFIGISLILSFAHPNFHLSRILEVVVTNHNDFVKISHGNNLIHFNRLEPTWMSMIINSPWAMISGLFRPFPGEGQGVLEFAASVENLFLLLLVVSAVIKFRKMFVPPWPVIALAALSYCVVLCVFLALSSPNLGTLSRYRIGFLPFFVFLVSYRNPWVHWIFSRWESKRF